MDTKELLERLVRIKKDMDRTEKKLAKSYRSARAKAHVQQKLKEQACQSNSFEYISSSVAPLQRGDEYVMDLVKTIDAEAQQVVNLEGKFQEQENKVKSEFVGRDLPYRPLNQTYKVGALTLLQEKMSRKNKCDSSPEVSSSRYEISGNCLERDKLCSQKICKNQIEIAQHIVNSSESHLTTVQCAEIASAPTMGKPETFLHSLNNTPISCANAKEHYKTGCNRTGRSMGKNVEDLPRSRISHIEEAVNARQNQSLCTVKLSEKFVGSVNDTKQHMAMANTQIVVFEDHQPSSQISDNKISSEHESVRWQNMPPEGACVPENQGLKYLTMSTAKSAGVAHVLGSSARLQMTSQDDGFTLQEQTSVMVINSSPDSSDLIEDSQMSNSRHHCNLGKSTRKRKKFSGQISEPCITKRQSLRIAVLSQQRSDSQNSFLFGSQNSQISDNLDCYGRKRMRKSKNQLIISSVFQFLVDEGKRKKSVESFSLPNGEYEVLLKQKEIAMPLHDSKSQSFVQTLNSRDDYLINSLEPERQIVKPDLIAETSDFRFYVPLQAESLYSSEKTFTKGNFKDHVNKLISTGSQVRENVKGLESDDICIQSPVISTGKEPPYLPNISTHVFDHDVMSKLQSTPVVSKLSPLVNTSCSGPLAQSVSYNITANSSDREEIPNQSKYMAHQGSFQIPPTNQVVCFAIGQLEDVTQSGFYLACLSSNCLSIWKMERDKWVNFYIEKIAPIRGTGGSSLHAMPTTGSIRLLVLLCCQEKTDLILKIFSAENKKVYQHHLMTSREKSVKVCPVKDRELIVYYPGTQSSVLTKYTLSTGNTRVHSTHQLEVVQGRLISIATITRLPQAVMGHTSSREVHIWNHMTGSLLVSVDIADICSQETLLYTAIAEQGFVFVPAFSKRCSQQPGSLIVINPILGTSETLCTYKASLFNSKWLGCTDCMQYKEFLIVLDNSGKVLIWNMYSGELAAELNDITCTGLSILGDYLILAHNNCFHVYR